MRVAGPSRKAFAFIGLLGLLCLVSGIGTEAVALEKAGVSAAVRGQVARANDEHPVGLQIASGEPIYLADRITSGPSAGMQIMLLDQTTFTIGPDSFVKIDEFVYDPNTGVGKVTASLGKGVFRFVTGKIAQTNPSNMTVKLPNATIGVRGTMVIGSTDGERTVVGLVGPGPGNNTHDKVAGIDVITQNGTAEIRRPGWGAIIERGQAPRVQQLPKPTIDGILNGVAPRDVAQASSNSSSAPTQSQSGAPSGTTAQQSSGGGGSASSASGQSSASAGPSLATFSIASDSQQTAAQTTTTATQVGAAALGAITTFEQLRSITSGTASFLQNGVALSDGTHVGHYDFSLIVDFGAQTGTGRWSNINFIGDFTVTNGLVGFGGGLNGDNGSYANDSGPVSCAASSNHDCGARSCAAGVTCTPRITVRNSGSIIGAFVDHGLTLSDGISGHKAATGGGTAQRQ
jgi:hypothetical protein